MCRYRKSLFLCNHSQVSSEPLSICDVQCEHLAKRASSPNSEPCDRVETHPRNTIRISTLCPGCLETTTSLDERFRVVKEKMAGLRVHLDEAYGDCMKHLDEAGLSVAKEENQDEDKQEEELDPIKAFLKAKMAEQHSHLMMLGSH